jgi:hypothetical protein
VEEVEGAAAVAHYHVVEAELAVGVDNLVRHVSKSHLIDLERTGLPGNGLIILHHNIINIA